MDKTTRKLGVATVGEPNVTPAFVAADLTGVHVAQRKTTCMQETLSRNVGERRVACSAVVWAQNMHESGATEDEEHLELLQMISSQLANYLVNAR